MTRSPAPGGSGVGAARAEVVVREVRPGDREALASLFEGLDPESRFLRWFTGGVDLLQAEDWAGHPERVGGVGLLALVGAEAVGHAVLVPDAEDRGEVAFEVAAPWRRQGIATSLLDRLVAAARARGLREVHADVLGENADMLAVMRAHAAPHAEQTDGSVTHVSLVLEAPA